jgi:hypothetical protein
MVVHLGRECCFLGWQVLRVGGIDQKNLRQASNILREIAKLYLEQTAKRFPIQARFKAWKKEPE